MDKKLKQLYKGKVVQFKHGDLEHLPHDIFDDVNSKMIMKSHMQGKGLRLALNNNEAEVLGGKFGGFKKVGSAFKKVGKTLGDTKKMQYGKNVMKVMDFQNKMSQGIAKATSGVPGLNRVTGAIALGNDKLTGFANDVHNSRKQGGNGNKIFKRALGRTVGREGKQVIQDKLNEMQGQARNYAQGQLNNYVGQATNYLGSGFGKALNKGIKVSKQVNSAPKKAGLNYSVGQMVKSYDNNNQISNRLKDTAMNYANEANNRALVKFDTLNNNLNNNLNSRMTAGSFRPAGGSFRTSGGSFRPAGGSMGLYDDLSPFLREDQPAFRPLQPPSLRIQKGY